VTKYFAPEDACFQDWSDLEACAGLCGATHCSPNKLRVHSSLITVTVESDQDVKRALDIRVISIRYLPPGCLCRQSKDCTSPDRGLCNIGDLNVKQALPAPACPTEQRCSGVCVAANWSPCEDTVGRSADGLVLASEAFRRAYALLEPRIGCPGCPNGCDPYVHYAFNVQLQDFFQPDSAQSYSSGGWTALAYNVAQDQAILLSGVFWETYICLSNGSAQMGGAAVLGAPRTEQHWDGAAMRQEFEIGSVVWSPPADAGTERVDIYLASGLDQAAVSPNCADFGRIVHFHAK
jgi:hypothetical protein